MKFTSKYKYALGYVLCVALSSLLRQEVMSNTSPVLILLISSVFASIYFHLINFRSIYAVYEKLMKQKMLFLQLNIIVAIMWVFTYYSIFFSSATLFVFQFFTTAAFLSAISFRKKDYFQVLFLCIFLLAIVIPFFVFNHYLLGMFFGVLAGGFGFFYNIITSKIASTLKINASQTLAPRFWFLIILLPFFLPNDISNQITTDNIMQILVITILSFILQIWFNQKSVIEAGGKETSLISCFAPLLTFLMQGVLLNNWFIPILFLSFFPPVYVLYEWKFKC